MARQPGEAYDRASPDRTWAVSTSSDTYYVSARTKTEAREIMGWTFDHDGIRDRKILNIVPIKRQVV